MSHLTVQDRLDRIAESGFRLVFDGCHKIYFMQDSSELDSVYSNGYEDSDIFPSSEIHALWERSCYLRFVHPFNLEPHRWDIPQGAEAEEEDTA